jgi:hypothetical protein
MSTDRDYIQRDRTSRPDRDDEDDYDFRRGARRYDRRYERVRDEEHLRILSILHYVMGGLAMLGGLFPLLYVFFGALMVSGAMGPPNSSNGPPAALGWALMVIGGGISLLILAFAVCLLYSGYCLYTHKHYMFSFVMACLVCLSVPLGTALGVFTIIVLVRPSVKELFEQPAEPLAAPVK